LDKLASHYGIPVQQQKTCSNWKNTIQIKLWKTPLERRPHGANGDSISRRIHEETTEKLGTSNECNRRSSEEYEEAV